jgi:hypothetical protein
MLGCPFRDALVVLNQAFGNILAETDVVLSRRILEDINLIRFLHISTKKAVTLGDDLKLGAGLGFEPRIRQLPDYEPDELVLN